MVERNTELGKSEFRRKNAALEITSTVLHMTKKFLTDNLSVYIFPKLKYLIAFDFR